VEPLSAIRSGFSFGANTKPAAAGRIVSPGNGHAIETPALGDWSVVAASILRILAEL